MTPQGISTAQDLARECVKKTYKDCWLHEEIYFRFAFTATSLSACEGKLTLVNKNDYH